MTATPGDDLDAAVIVGNPKLGSRTSTVATTVAQRILAHAGVGDQGDIAVVELATLGANLFTWGDAEVEQAKRTVLGRRLLIVASPVYKASFTGLLKAFLDQFNRDELAAAATVPVMVGGSPIHHLAMEGQLRPVLVEIGASCPTRGVYILEQELDTLDEQIDKWLRTWGNAIIACARAAHPA